jgi:hypothetical protein
MDPVTLSLSITSLAIVVGYAIYKLILRIKQSSCYASDGTNTISIRFNKGKSSSPTSQAQTSPPTSA